MTKPEKQHLWATSAACLVAFGVFTALTPPLTSARTLAIAMYVGVALYCALRCLTEAE